MELFVNPIALWLIASRLSGWMLLSPGFAEINTPQLTRAAMILWLSYLLLPLVGPITPQAHLYTMPDIIVAVVGEFIIGAGYGLVLRLIFGAVQFGGVLLDNELGFLYAQQVNPALPVSGGIFSRLFLLMAILYFWTFDYFRIVMAAIHQSFILIPLGVMDRPLFDFAMLVKLGAALFAGGLTFAAPIMALMFFVTITVGFLARTVQGMNIFSDVFVFKVAVGLIGILVFLPLLFFIMKVQMEKIIPMSSEYFKFLSPS
ncbi:MAG: flagellar biosynthetic protein FliR [Verrucomicrobium sp.]|nr:flagellar biosynthetic protein FliR [Verrucomicrobium sp.]